MGWSLKVGMVSGIAVRIHATFLLLLGWVALSHYLVERSIPAALDGVVFILAVFACVLLHEFGHAIAARRYGVKTRDITLLPIGGIARLQRIPEDPMQELVVALAGPAVNVVIAVVLYGLVQVRGDFPPPEEASSLVRGSMLWRLLVVNVWIVLFNLLPAFPMDGGRVLRALLSTRLDRVRATRIATSIGQAAALGLGFLGLFTNPFLVFVALFVWIGAGQESDIVSARSALAGLPARAAMITEFHVLAPNEDLSRAVDLLLSGSQTDFPVVLGNRAVGMLRRQDLVRSLRERGQETKVEEVMARDFPTAAAGEPLEELFGRLQTGEWQTIPVVAGSSLLGLLTTHNLGELLMVRSALRQRREVPRYSPGAR